MLYVIIVTAVLALAGVGLFWFFRRERQRGPIHASPPPVVFIPRHAPDAPEPVPPAAGMHAPGAHASAGFAAGYAPPPGPLPASAFAPPQPPQQVPLQPFQQPLDAPPLAQPAAQAAAQAAAPAASRPGPQLVELPVELPVARTMIVGADGAPRSDEAREHPDDPGIRPTRRRRRGPARLAEDEEEAPVPLSATGTLRMLPGRFEVVEGHPADREIRFVAEPGTADQRFTMGRGEGPPTHHVRLHGQTVSRMHAALSFRGGTWMIENLSTTNPLRVNGREMTSEQAAALLSDGDIVELGEVVLRFRT